MKNESYEKESYEKESYENQLLFHGSVIKRLGGLAFFHTSNSVNRFEHSNLHKINVSENWYFS